MKKISQRAKRGRASAPVVQRGKRQPRTGGLSLSGIFVLSAVAVAAYFSGLRLSPIVAGLGGGSDGSVRTVSFEDEGKIAVAGSQPRKAGEVDGIGDEEGSKQSKPKPVKAASGSVFSEGEAPSIVGQVPEGWRVETSNDIKIKFGPHKVPVGDDITFVVPVYTLVPSDSPDGVYIIEPGRTKDGHDEGGTLPSVLSRLESESQAVCGALGALSDAIGMLPGEEPPAEAAAVAEANAANGGGEKNAEVAREPVAATGKGRNRAQ